MLFDIHGRSYDFEFHVIPGIFRYTFLNPQQKVHERVLLRIISIETHHTQENARQHWNIFEKLTTYVDRSVFPDPGSLKHWRMRNSALHNPCGCWDSQDRWIVEICITSEHPIMREKNNIKRTRIMSKESLVERREETCTSQEIRSTCRSSWIWLGRPT